MIKLVNLSKHFGKLQVLNRVSVTCNRGECIALIGPNGCGKTTLIKSILGMVICNEGEIFFDNKAIRGEWAYRDQIGYMPQIGRYPENMRIGQVLDMMKDIRGHSGRKKLDETLVRDFGLQQMMDKRMETLSGGTRQKVSAALAFLFNPDVLILDEPTAGLDPVSSEILKEKIRDEKEKGKLIIITSHVLSELDDIISEVIFMQEGKICFHKSLDLLKEETGEKKLAKVIAHTILETQEA